MVKVLKAGFYSTIQDLGRYGCQQYGVPYSGAMDQYSAQLANAILGNKADAPVIEMTILGATLEFGINTFICITGADISAQLNAVPIPLNRVVEVGVGDVLSFGKLHKGVRCYLAVLGGLRSEEVLGSQSMYKGVTQQSVLKKGNEFKIESRILFSKHNNASVKVNNEIYVIQDIEVFKGPEFDLLVEKQQEALVSQVFTISKHNNRMAYQLQESFGNSLEAIITSAVLPGTVQLTPSGQLIILMRDCQTTGGYPRVLQLKESAINILAQKFTGNTIRFKLIG